MTDIPTPYLSINDENETLNNPSLNEEKQTFNINKDCPKNIETTNATNSICSTYPKSDTSKPITFKSLCNWFSFIFIFAGFGFGIGFTFLSIKDGSIGVAIVCNVFTLVGIGFCFSLKYSSMTIDVNRGIISIKICKIYYCKNHTYNIDDIEEIEFRKSDYNGLKSAEANYEFYDIVLIFPGGRRVIGATRSDENAGATNDYNTLKSILPQHIKKVNNLQPFLSNE